MKINTLKSCRCCNCDNLTTLFSLGEQYLTGVFPQQGEAQPPKAPLTLVMCEDCGLVQLKHSCEPEFLYGPTYGYRSGLNASMRLHLKKTADYLTDFAQLQGNEVICDIGCNDGTLLGYFSTPDLKKVGIDPLADKFKKHHPFGLNICSDFFSRETYFKTCAEPARIITSLSMFYDLSDPVKFAKDVRDCLDDNGIWFFEQSYLYLMLETNSYDTICHEHLEYYSIQVVDFILTRAGMKIVDLSTNDINGGSMAVTAVKMENPLQITRKAKALIEAEGAYKLKNVETYQAFIERCDFFGKSLKEKLSEIKQKGLIVAGYGASTKGNVLLQYLGITEDLLPFILEINEEKRGCVTPGTNIPILLEDEVDLRQCDYLVVLPWHFREGIIQREKEFLDSGGKFIFPLPRMEIYPESNE